MECAECERLEQAFIRPRTETTRLLLTGRAAPIRLHELEEEEMARLWAIIDHELEHALAES
jgi:hypothetical protein